jgi:hypothetical protein
MKYRLPAIFAITFLVAIALSAWRSYELSHLRSLRRERQLALVEWRRVKGLYDRQGSSVAADEAAAREMYFQTRSALEKAGDASWWRDHH